MNINWSTVFFQIINFLIIVWILKKYLFTPVLSSMDKREHQIQKRLHDAQKSKQEAQAEKQRLDSRIAELDAERASIMAEAYKKADAEYATLLKTFNAEMAGKRKAFEEQIITERDLLRASISELAGKAIVSTVQSALSGLANTDIQSAILNGFIDRVSTGKIEKATDLKHYYKKEAHLTVRTSFDLTKKDRDGITTALSSLLDEKPKNLDFVIDKDIICGIEITCPPILISYGVNTYIAALAKNLDDGLANITQTEKNIDKKNNEEE